MRRRIVCIAAWIFVCLYLIALAVLAIGTFGLFGATADPLSGVFLIPLAMPWLGIAEWLGVPPGPVPVIVAPLVTLGVLAALCHLVRRSAS